MKKIYSKVLAENGLKVGISEVGLHVSELTNVRGLIDDPKTPWLQTSAIFPWEKVESRERSYAGDDLNIYALIENKDKRNEYLVNAAISLIAYWGGTETWLSRKSDFELPKYF